MMNTYLRWQKKSVSPYHLPLISYFLSFYCKPFQHMNGMILCKKPNSIPNESKVTHNTLSISLSSSPSEVSVLAQISTVQFIWSFRLQNPLQVLLCRGERGEKVVSTGFAADVQYTASDRCLSPAQIGTSMKSVTPCLAQAWARPWTDLRN